MQDNDKENISVRDALKLIPPRRRRGAAWMVAGSLLLALLDFAGIAALVSALLVVLDPQAMVEYPVIAHIYSALGFGSVNGLVITVAVAALAVIALKSLFTLTVSNAMNKYLLSLYRHYSTRMFDIYLSKGLLFIRRNHTSQLVNNVNGVCLRFTEGVLGQLLGILSTALLLVLIFTVLLIYDPMIVLLAVVVFLPLALVYSRFFRRRMVENGKMENKLFVGLNKTMYETLRGYSDVEINNAEAFVSEKFTGGLKNLADYRRRAALVRGASGSVVEFSLVLGVVIMIVGGLSMGSDMASLRVSLGVFAIAAYKIVPAVNRIVNNWVEYKRNSFAGGILRDSFADAPEVDFSAQSKEKMPFEKELVLRDVSFTYDGAGPETESQTEPRSKVEYNDKKVLDRFSLTVKKGEKIGIRGYSGAGKSTLFNIVCGFFEPASGAITIDGVPLTADNRRRWQNNLAYVSQDVFIPDMTIAENIAFGVDHSEIDMQRLDKVIRAASLDGLIASLPDGADTVTGESGCRLSGGQRQRIGIARALYKNASVLLFDEATSSLDSKTEDEIVMAIEKLSVEDSGLTMLIISHRDRTLNFCDRIIELD